MDDQEDGSKQGEIAKIDADEDVTLEEVAAKVPKDADVHTARRRKGVVIRDSKETTTPSVIVHSEPKSKNKGKGILVEEPKPFKKQAQIEQDATYARELEAQLNANINWNEVIEQRFNSIVAFLEKGEEEIEEEARKIISNDEDDVYSEATPLALKVPVVDYQIHSENNKPYYKIIRADETHQLFLSFISLLRNFDREDEEMLCLMLKLAYGKVKVADMV
nr:hypothetical protein [Tanacetum cinerariifolium]